MDHPITIFNMIVLAGMLQGSIALVSWAFKSIKNTSSFLLSAILLIITLLSFKILLHTFGLWEHPGWHYLPLAIDTTIQPLFYLYACALTDQHYRFTRKKLAHFIPTAVFMCHALVVYIATAGYGELGMKDHIAALLFYNQAKLIEDVVAILSGITYWLLSFQRIQHYRHWLFQNQSDTRFEELSWLRNLMLCTGILLLVLILSSLTENILQSGRIYFIFTQIFYVYLSVLTFYLAYKVNAAVHTDVMPVRPKIVDHPYENESGHHPSLFIKESLVVVKKDKMANYQTIQSTIHHALESDKLFLNPLLSLKELSTAIGYPLNQVSGAINYSSNQNFRNLVNTYRVNEVKKRLADPNCRQYSLTGIAFDCGFNSEASFYRIFRQHTGVSPGIYFSKGK